LYGSESWTILTKYEIRITGAEMRYKRKRKGKEEGMIMETPTFEEY
jgi:hypothetical protein